MSANPAFSATAVDRLARKHTDKVLMLEINARVPTAAKFSADITSTSCDGTVGTYVLNKSIGSFITDGVVVGSRLAGSLVPASIESGTIVTQIISATQLQLDRPILTTFTGQSARFEAGRKIRVSSDPYRSPDGHYWQPSIVRASGIKAGRADDFPNTGPDLVSTSVTISRAKLTYQSNAAANADDALAELAFVGSSFVMYLGYASAPAMGDIPPILWGRINRVASSPDSITLFLMQANEWIRPLPTRTNSVENHPNSPESTRGAPIGVYLGNLAGFEMRPPWPTYTSWKDYVILSGRAALQPALLTDTGAGAGSLEAATASHELGQATVGGSPFGWGVFVEGGQFPSYLEEAGLVSSLPSPTVLEESFIRILDEGLIAISGGGPTDVRISTLPKLSTANNPRNAINVQDETTYADIDTASHSQLVLIMPDLASLGRILSVQLVIGYSSTMTGGAGKAYRYNQSTSTAGAKLNLPSTGSHAAPTVAKLTLAAVDAGVSTTDDWNLSGGAAVVDLVVDKDLATAGSVRIYFIGYHVRYRIQQNLLTPVRLGPLGHTPGIGAGEFPRERPQALVPRYPAIYETSASLMWLGLGPRDGAGAVYSGGSFGDIVRPPDQLRFVMSRWSGLAPATDFALGTEYGSWEQARADLRTRLGNEYTLTPAIPKFTDVAATLRRFAEQSLSWIFLDRFTNKWMWRTWSRWPDRTFDRVFQAEDFETFDAEWTSDTEVARGARVAYAGDQRTGRALLEAIVTADASDMGYDPDTRKDQRLEIIAGVQDRLDFRFSGTVFAADFPNALNLDGPEMARELQYRLRWALSPGTAIAPMWASWGQNVTSGHLDRLDVLLAGNTYVVAMQPARYNLRGWAAELQRSLRATTGNQAWTVVYSPTAGTMTIACGGASFSLLRSSGANRLRSVLGSLGDTHLTDFAGTSYAITCGPKEECFRITWGTSGTNSLLLATGANVARSIHKVLGWRATDGDQTGAATYQAPRTRGDRQLLSQRAIDQFKAAQILQLDGEWIRSSEIAGDLRDRAADFTLRPRVRVTATTHVCPDIRRGDVVEMGSSVDTLGAYPFPGSNGSWSARRFWVLEVSQSLGPSFHQDLVLIEAGGF